MSNFIDLFYFHSIRPPSGLLPVLGLLERYMTPTLDAALLYSSRVGSDLGLIELTGLYGLKLKD